MKCFYCRSENVFWMVQMWVAIQQVTVEELSLALELSRYLNNSCGTETPPHLLAKTAVFEMHIANPKHYCAWVKYDGRASLSIHSLPPTIREKRIFITPNWGFVIFSLHFQWFLFIGFTIFHGFVLIIIFQLFSCYSNVSNYNLVYES